MGDIRISAINSIQSIDSWLKILAGNLTGSNVTGYRQQRAEFSDVLTEHISAGNASIAGAGSINPIDLPSGGMQLKATKTDFSQGSLQSTGQPTDLGVQGDSFFLLSKSPKPTMLQDLVFTRNGSFHYDFVQTSPPTEPVVRGEFRLINQDGLFVMGFKSTEDGAYRKNAVANLPGVAVPPGEVTTSGSLPGVVGAGFNFEAITIPVANDPNPTRPADLNADFAPTFNSQGWAQIKSDAPFVDSFDKKKRLIQFVALGKVSDPAGFIKLQGGTEFQWNAVAGNATFGVAASGDSSIGKNNTINPGSLETSNSSVNTTLPELTIAQKSFTASVKIVQVGNNLIDDVNNLVR